MVYAYDIRLQVTSNMTNLINKYTWKIYYTIVQCSSLSS